ncbi:MAG: 16S rRNA (cytosine(967)-C(5))-methyltransferase [Gallionellales bacterium 35-53-114]|jgi:16S rRNA (cytosine967-C5)-methyltransferase|nr:MAG: 16S rRNA (cytosine(967)-C(5))-methyltransferase [Gallionellales bacterium 35-53-114]OYZ63560.1 MAG: 16S rRNA (cytosine(967)-C(5))-methyltransferase [Gallionellales bacterium 24-53-125]OZB10830.1 MAG: 16S rRNA (cytosine(967)-C(5))-methyltransferase [Gallionellales bacterium 39-52-133]HQS58996.1 16S rRNA (cytosine(967)-C(5))-methyltransferase RsmB [Gallionellaceae bacterium]HQS75619.1 16S rRNA (cytosine(967)-C(5))-methyltransferase RsmB [Gallionellaceae bacterium]
MDTVQQAAVTIISQVLSGRNLNQVLSEVLSASTALTQQQRGALQDLSYGTLRYYGQLSSVLDALLNKPVQDIQIRYLLLIALYQLEYSKAAPHAVVDFAVNAVRKRNPAASGLVNAILRNFLRNKSPLLLEAARTEEGRYSYPQWWINEVKSQYGDKAEAILLAGNTHPPMTLRVNHRRTTPTDYLGLLMQNGIQARVVEPDAIQLEQALPVDKLPGFMDGLVSVQDAGAQYAAGFLDVQQGMRVLDACAAPGGKSAHLLELAEIELTALDKDVVRLERVQENMQRLQLRARLLTGDAAIPADWWDGQLFQRILADVPCSATGVVRRHPDIKWLRRAADIQGFAQQQLQILNALWPLLAAEGKLLYATCSIFGRENQQVINEFLSTHSDAKQLSLAASGMIQGQLLPNDEHDGFFYALLHKPK